MAITKEAFVYLGTWNNPQDHCDTFANFDYKTATPEQFTQLQYTIVDMFVHASPRARKPETSSIMVACEVGENGTFHTHMLFMAKRKLSFKQLQAIYPGIHLAVTRGSYEENVNYLTKTGTAANEAKAKTKLCEPITWGDYIYEKGDPTNKHSVFDTINNLLDEGMTPEQIYALSPKLSFYANAIERTYTARKNTEMPSYQERTVYYHVGESGTSKTYSTYIGLQQKYGKDNVFKTPNSWKNIWDKYNYEHIVIFDEMRGSSIRYSELLGYLDNYKLILSCRYADKYADYDEVHITTIDPPEELYDWNNREVFSSFDSRDQLYRRINYIVYHWKDHKGFHQYELPFNEYTGYDGLKFLAELNYELEGNPLQKEIDWYYRHDHLYMFMYDHEPEPIEFTSNPFN